VQQGSGALVHHSSAVRIKQIGLKQIRRMLVRTTLLADELRPLIGELETCRGSDDAFTWALRTEYKLGCRAVDDLKRGRLTLDDLWERATAAPLRLMMLKRNKTKRLFAATYGRLIADAAKPGGAAWLPEPRHGAESVYMLRLFLSGNGLGLYMRDGLAAPLALARWQKCRDNTVIGATQALIALKCYRSKYGGLPDGLAELVPEFLDAVPTDDFDGQPLRYSQAKEIVYSVGPDFTDDGGVTTSRTLSATLYGGGDEVFELNPRQERP